MEDTRLDIVMSLDGIMLKKECRFLLRLASQVDHGCIIEIGSYRGRSTAALAYGVVANDRQTRIYAIDPHESYIGCLGGIFGPKDRGEFFKAMLKTELYDIVRLVNLSSEIITPGWKLAVDMLWIDGDHTAAGVRRDYECWNPHLVAGGIIAFHDSVTIGTPPNLLVNEILNTCNFARIDQVGEITAMRKLG